MLVSDSGMALAVVMLMSVILFLLAETAVMLPTYRALESGNAARLNTSRQLAEVGINEYMEQLRRSYSFYKTNPAYPTDGPRYTSDGGSWRVFESTTPSGTVKLKAISRLPNGTVRVLESYVRFPSWAKYIVLVDKGPYSIGTGATFYGDVHCNEGISNSGVITGEASTVSPYTCSWGTSKAVNYPGGIDNNVDKKDFNAVATDLAAMKTSAQTNSSYYGALGTGYLGYSCEINGAQATVYKITAVNKNQPRTGVTPADPLIGTLTKTLVGTVIIPAEGVLYFDDDVWVTGTYGVAVTVASSGTIYCPANLVPANNVDNLTCGLVAEGQILFPWWYDTMPDNQLVQAALLSRTAGVGPDAPSGLKKYNTSTKGWTDTLTLTTSDYKSSVTIKGARAMVQMIGFSSGYTIRNFDKDPVLANNPPPLYPKLPGDGLMVSTWTERAWNPGAPDYDPQWW